MTSDKTMPDEAMIEQYNNYCKEKVRELGDKIGYGAVMQLAELIWRDKAKSSNLDGSELTVGPCGAFMVPCPHTFKDDMGHCEICCGSGRITKFVHDNLATRPETQAGDLYRLTKVEDGMRLPKGSVFIEHDKALIPVHPTPADDHKDEAHVNDTNVADIPESVGNSGGNTEALEWVEDAFQDIDESRVKLRGTTPILDRAERCLKTIKSALVSQKQPDLRDKEVCVSQAGSKKALEALNKLVNIAGDFGYPQSVLDMWGQSIKQALSRPVVDVRELKLARFDYYKSKYDDDINRDLQYADGWCDCADMIHDKYEVRDAKNT